MKLNHDIKISAIICCYHGVKTVYDALCSLEKQSLMKSRYEIIVVDNGSIDGSSVEIDRFVNGVNSSIIDVFKISNEGLSNARNYGYKKAKGDFVFYMDDDAYADEMCLEVILESFLSNPSLNVLGGTVGILNHDNGFAKLYHNSIFSYWMEGKSIIIGTNMSFRKSLLIESEGFIKNLKYRGDESAFFAKNKRLINASVNKAVIVWHTQPERLKSFLKSRFENGQAKAFLTLSFDNNAIKAKLKNVFNFLIRLFSSGIGFALSVILWFLLSLNFVVIILLASLWALRFICHNDLRGSLLMYVKKDGKSYVLYDYFYIVFFVSLGSFLEDLGYVLSYWKLTFK